MTSIKHVFTDGQ